MADVVTVWKHRENAREVARAILIKWIRAGFVNAMIEERTDRFLVMKHPPKGGDISEAERVRREGRY